MWVAFPLSYGCAPTVNKRTLPPNKDAKQKAFQFSSVQLSSFQLKLDLI